MKEAHTTTPPHAALLAQVEQLLSGEHSQVTRLHEVLKLETLALQSQNAVSMTEILGQKTLVLSALERSQSLRFALLAQQQCEPSEDNWKALIAALDTHAGGSEQPLITQLNELLLMTEKCRTVNSVNEKIVARSQFSVQHLLDILRGNVPNNQLYGARGNAVALNEGKPITSA